MKKFKTFIIIKGSLIDDAVKIFNSGKQSEEDRLLKASKEDQLNDIKKQIEDHQQVVFL